MASIKVKKVPVGGGKQARRELYATLCWYYPQYTLQNVQAMPARDVHLLIKTAQRQEARYLLNLTQIAAAPHTKNGSGVKNLMQKFKDASK